MVSQAKGQPATAKDNRRSNNAEVDDSSTSADSAAGYRAELCRLVTKRLCKLVNERQLVTVQSYVRGRTLRLAIKKSHQASMLIQARHRGNMIRQKTRREKQRQTLKAAFNTVDVSGDGKLDIDELGALLISLGQDFTDAELRDKVRTIDTDGSGEIEFEEFEELITQFQEAELLDIFAFFDTDGSGDIGMEELQYAIQALGKNLTEQEISTLVASVDSDMSGHIDAEEFCQFMRPLMTITKSFQYHVKTLAGLSNVSMNDAILHIGGVGIQLSASASGQTTTTSEHTDRRRDAVPRLVTDKMHAAMNKYQDISTIGYARLLDYTTNGKEVMLTVATQSEPEQLTFGGIDGHEICDVIKQQLAKRELRRKLQLHKQHKQLRHAFQMIDESGDEKLDLSELRTLLQTLGQELSDASLREKIRQIDHKITNVNEINFEQFANMMTVWQDEEVTDVFNFFDDDDSGCISVCELSTAVRALAGHSMSVEEADRLSKHVDSDGSGEIDKDEFQVFMRPLMAISQRNDYQVHEEETGVEITLSVGLLGLQLTNETTSHAFSFVSLVKAEDTKHSIVLSFLLHGAEKMAVFTTAEATTIVDDIARQQTRMTLRRDVQVNKQQRELRKVFDIFDSDGGGSIGTAELHTLLETLGQNLTEQEVASKIKEYDTDNTGDISFDEFAVWMGQLQEQELEDAFHLFDYDDSGSISVRELQHLIRSMGEEMTDKEIHQLASHVDSDGSGEIDVDELKVLMRPMMTLTDRAVFAVVCDAQPTELIISGLGVELQQNGSRRTFPFSKIIDIDRIQHEVVVVVKGKEGNLSKICLRTDKQREILLSVRKQQGKLSLRSAIERSKEPTNSSFATAMVVIKTESSKRSKAQLSMLRKFLSSADLFDVMGLTNELQQLQCCRYLTAERYAVGDVIFEEGDYAFSVYHIIDGVVSIRKNGLEVRQQWKGASFGALTVTGELVAPRTPGIVCIIDCMLVKLSRADYLRICGSLEAEVATILQKPCNDRIDMELQVAKGLFQEAQLFRMLFYESLQLACCSIMQYHTARQHDIITHEGAQGSEMFCVMTGTMEGRTQDKDNTTALAAGDSIGLDCVLGSTLEEQCHSTTVTVMSDSSFGTLTRDNFLHVSDEIGEAAVKILETASNKRSESQIDNVYSLLRQLPFLVRLRSRLLQRHCCRYMRAARLEKGQLLFQQGEIGDSMFVVISGSMSIEKWRNKNNKRRTAKRRGEVERCRIGMTFGEECLTANTEFARRRAYSVRAHENSILAVLHRDHYMRISRTGELQAQINCWWEMCMNEEFQDSRASSTDLCHEKLYKKLHLAVSKSIQKEWYPDEAQAEVHKDWIRDLARHNSGNDILNHRHFSDALFELVDEWCGTISVQLYSDFLTIVYENIRHEWKTDPKTGVTKYVLKDLRDITSVNKQMAALKTEGQKLKLHDSKVNVHAVKYSTERDSVTDNILSPPKFRALNEAHVMDDHIGDIGARERAIATAQLEWLKSDRAGATFASTEEQEYFFEMLATRAVGPPHWLEKRERQFREQLGVNVDFAPLSKADSAGGMGFVLDELQQFIIGGATRKEKYLQQARAAAEKELASLLASTGENMRMNEENRREVLNRIMRKQEGNPYWLTPGDDIEDFVARRTFSVKSLVLGEGDRFAATDVARQDRQQSFAFDTLKDIKSGWMAVTSESIERVRERRNQLNATLQRGPNVLPEWAGFQMPVGGKIDVSHVRSMIDCGQRQRKRNKRRRKQKAKGKTSPPTAANTRDERSPALARLIEKEASLPTIPEQLRSTSKSPGLPSRAWGNEEGTLARVRSISPQQPHATEMQLPVPIRHNQRMMLSQLRMVRRMTQSDPGP